MTIIFYKNGKRSAKLLYNRGGKLNVQFRNGQESQEFNYDATPERVDEMADLARKIVDDTVAWEHINWDWLWQQSSL